MKKKILLVSLLAICSVSSSFAYKIKMINRSGIKLQIKVDTAGFFGTCADKSFVLHVGQTKVHDTGACCVKEVIVSPSKNVKQKYYYYPKRTGASVSCINDAFVILKSNDTLILEKR